MWEHCLRVWWTAKGRCLHLSWPRLITTAHTWDPLPPGWRTASAINARVSDERSGRKFSLSTFSSSLSVTTVCLTIRMWAPWGQELGIVCLPRVPHASSFINWINEFIRSDEFGYTSLANDIRYSEITRRGRNQHLTAHWPQDHSAV